MSQSHEIHKLVISNMAVLEQAPAIAPYNSSNRLKRAQLVLLLGRHDEAGAMLAELSTAKLNRPEREKYLQIRACLEHPNASTACIAK